MDIQVHDSIDNKIVALASYSSISIFIFKGHPPNKIDGFFKTSDGEPLDSIVADYYPDQYRFLYEWADNWYQLDSSGIYRLYGTRPPG